MKVVFATSNLNKWNEIKLMMPSTIELINLKTINVFEDIPETADTIEGNAFLKANYVYENFHFNCFADDTGLEVEALGGAPGVFSARFAGEDKNAEDNMDLLLKKLENKTNRRAQFKTVIALRWFEQTHLFEGIVSGKIVHKKNGEFGFGYDPIFVPDGHQKTFAEMTNEEKASISHRGIAVKKLIEFLHEK